LPLINSVLEFKSIDDSTKLTYSWLNHVWDTGYICVYNNKLCVVNSNVMRVYQRVNKKQTALISKLNEFEIKSLYIEQIEKELLIALFKTGQYVYKLSTLDFNKHVPKPIASKVDW
jgi:hypothetical protein